MESAAVHHQAQVGNGGQQSAGAAQVREGWAPADPAPLGLAAFALTSFGAFWLSFWAFVTFFEGDVPAANVGDAVGLYLIAWGIFTTYTFVASLRTNAAVALVFVLLAATFFLLGIGNSGGNEGLIEVGGWFGPATTAAAWYASFAAVVNSTFGRTALPVRPLGN